MKKINVENAVGLELCHDITAMRDGFKGAAFKRGHIIKEEDIPTMVERAYKEANPLYPVPKIMSKEDFTAMYHEIAAK